MQRHRLWIDGKWLESPESREIKSPFNGEVLARADYATREQMGAALAAAETAFGSFKRVSRFARSKLLELMRDGLRERQSELVRLIATEAGKPVTIAEIEFARALATFTIAAEEAKRFGGEVIPIDTDGGGRAYAPAVSYWVPRGPVLGITPFNFPLNLVAHKVAPALAVGAPILIKPAPQAPGPAAVLAEIFEKAARQASDARETIPLAGLQVLSCDNEIAGLAVTDPRITVVSFTGSGKVGWMLQAKAIGKRVLLELGGNAGVIVHSDADLARAAARCAAGGYGYAGQSCISVQRIFVQKDVAPRFEQLLVTESEKTPYGDPMKKETVVGPVIDKAAGDRIMSWIDEAKRGGARVLTGGKKDGNVIAPTVITGAGPEMKVSNEEIFGPLVTIQTYDKFSDAIAAVNHSRYGLQAGIFTDSVKLAREAVENLDVGGVIINEVPTYRADQMPYGGVKESGLGREGLRYAMEEMSERRVVVTWHG
jgi:glyceraldehyde-3-phosphate dehydrogenase (NADP+)